LEQTFTPNANRLGTTQRQAIKGAILSRPNDMLTLKSSMQSIGTLNEIEAEQQRLRESYSQTKIARK